MLAVVDTNHLSEIDRSAAFARQFEARRRADGLVKSAITAADRCRHG
jgi:hypothetical protein